MTGANLSGQLSLNVIPAQAGTQRLIRSLGCAERGSRFRSLNTHTVGTEPRPGPGLFPCDAVGIARRRGEGLAASLPKCASAASRTALRNAAPGSRLALMALLLVAGLFVSLTANAQAPPRRIVSLNLCADQILIDLVQPARIAALSHLAADAQVSPIADRVGAIALTRGEAEDVLAYDPDLVVAGTWSTPATVALLRRLGRRVETVPLASDIEGIGTLVRQIATAVGEPERGAALLAELEQGLSRIRREVGEIRTTDRPTALVYQVNGLASGSASLADAVMLAAGFRNLATEISLGAGGQVSLEALVANPPHLLILTGPVDEYRTAVAANLRHPALTSLRNDGASTELAWRHWLCGSHHVLAAVEQLAALHAHPKLRALRP